MKSSGKINLMAMRLAIEIPKGMTGEDVAKTLNVYLRGLDLTEPTKFDYGPKRKDTPEERWVLNDSNDYWLWVSADGKTAEISCRYSVPAQETVIEAMRALFTARYGSRMLTDEDLITRAVFIRVQDDSALVQLAHENRCTRNELIRAAIIAKLAEWKENPDHLLRDLQIVGVRLKNPES